MKILATWNCRIFLMGSEYHRDIWKIRMRGLESAKWSISCDPHFSSSYHPSLDSRAHRPCMSASQSWISSVPILVHSGVQTVLCPYFPSILTMLSLLILCENYHLRSAMHLRVMRIELSSHWLVPSSRSRVLMQEMILVLLRQFQHNWVVLPWESWLRGSSHFPFVLPSYSFHLAFSVLLLNASYPLDPYWFFHWLREIIDSSYPHDSCVIAWQKQCRLSWLWGEWRALIREGFGS